MSKQSRTILMRVVRWRDLVVASALIIGCLGFSAAAWQEPPSERQPISPQVRELMDRALGADSPFRQLFEEALEEGRPIPLPPRLMERLMRTPDGQEFLAEINRRFFDPRRHKPERFEKQHQEMLREFLPVVQQAPSLALAILRGGEQIALATVVDADGWLVSKASELRTTTLETDVDRDVDSDIDNLEEEAKPPVGDLVIDERPLQLMWRGSLYPLQFVAADAANDLALLRVPLKDLPMGSFAERAELGDFVVTPDADDNVVAVGVVSVGVRSLVGADRGFLGVQMRPELDNGVVIDQVVADSAALEAGVKIGDRVVAVDGETILSMTHMRNVISRHRAGDNVLLSIRRNGQVIELTAVLRGQSVSGLQAQQFNLMNTLGADPSRRRTDFPAVLQHDSQILPEMAGGPLLNLQGQVVGVNIARGGRIESYAIPASTVLSLAQQLRSATP